MPGFDPSLHPAVQIHESCYLDEPCRIGAGTRIWHFCHLMRGVRIGEGCTIGQNVFLGEGVVLGRNVKVQNNVSLYSGCELEDEVFCGPSVVFTNILHPRAEISRRGEFLATQVGRGATLGANATILCGHRIGSYALVGAGAVVTGDVPAYGLWYGVPACQAGWVCHCGLTLPALVAATTRCGVCGRRYRQEAGQLHPE